MNPMKEIYSGQTFSSFEVLEQCLKRYAIQSGLEIRTARAEKKYLGMKDSQMSSWLKIRT